MTGGNPNYIPVSLLTEYQLDTRNSTFGDILRKDTGLEHDGLDFDPPYQRASIWTNEQRTALIMSLLQGLPVGAIFINDRGDFVRRIVDGKQRMETVQAWYNNEFGVPQEWFHPSMIAILPQSNDQLYWENLSRRAQRFFETSATVSTYWTKLKTVEEEADLYQRINYGGTPHEPLIVRT